nr:hypothetical protein [Tanacetum cinerariifolium]
MQKVRAMNKQQLIEEYEYICKRLENDRLLSAQDSLFRPKPAITEPSAKRQRVEEPSSQPATVFATSISATVVSAAPRFTDSTVITTAAMDSAVTRRKVGVSLFADSVADALPFLSSIAGGPSPSNVFDVSAASTEFFLDSDEEMPPGVSRVAVEPYFDDEVVAEIIFRGQSICGDRRGEAFLCDRPVEDFFSSDSDSGDDDSEYSLSYSEFKDWEVVRCPPGNSYIHVYHREDRRQKYFTYLKELLPHVYPHDIQALRRKMNRHFRLNPDADDGLDLWRDVNMLCRSLHVDDVEEFWHDQDDWIMSC